ncbi:hypothetical protein [Kurthia senegalensis]|uniref:hypothetical protein n=1 Tax=Kurthia senegalensis TaxID=1033740 RepID=UPI0002E4C893|nr:hypothetical protein [Kurthia senegalensis]
MSRFLTVLLFFILTTIATFSALILPPAHLSSMNVAYTYQILIFPAFYVFNIIFIIYIILTYWIYLQWKNQHTSYALTWKQVALFSFSAMGIIVWIFLCQHHYFISAFGFIVLSTILLSKLHMTYDSRLQSSTRFPITLLYSWLAIVCTLHFAFIFVYYSYDTIGFSKPLWAVSFLTIATVYALYIRYKRSDPFFPMLFIWWLLGVVCSTRFDELLVTTSSLFLMGVLAIGTFFIRKYSSVLNTYSTYL